MSKAEIIEKAIKQMEDWAADSAHGYDQLYRWGEKGDYDCSAAVISAWENAGVPVKTKGATYTGNMLSAFKKCGFKDITSTINLYNGSGLKRGDVLLNQTHHAAMYCGNGYEVEASINEKGGVIGGKPGDQTGREFLKRTYRNYPWTNILRYTDEMPEAVVNVPDTKIDSVREVQIWLNNNYSSGLTVDNLYGSLTKKALVKALQKELGMLPRDIDGIYGPKTNSKVKVLKRGSKGNLVKVLQALLVCNGQKAAYVDGDFGSGTESAVKTIQKLHKIEVDGEAGQDTFSKLCK
jgi:cell wall-associated NlpC family hydrolase